ncbi:serine protease [Pseudomonas sp. GX19020]|uniref:serine protease n=1 Tax=Pseudomonas sp. GX19020 TaxID=2942277 RepID=UPI002019F71C|nr:serine protease [Pseudomonas sp. GX19020]MCL4065861.1 serine protease [Pseudomonas sp. GX19020]
MTSRFMPATVVRPLSALVLLCSVTGMALAESPAVTPGFGAKTSAADSSPYSFAASGAKAERGEKAAKAEPSGAKVVGGQPAADGAWPWQVAFLLGGQPISTDSQFCGGSMVMDRWVLTAAHCVHMADDAGNGADLKPGDFDILVGTNLLDGSGDRVPVEAVFTYPSYSVNDFDYDIALVKLARKPQGPYKTVEVPDATYGDILREPGITTVVTGWGLQAGAVPSSQLMQAQIQMLDRELCNQVLLEGRAEEAVEGFAFAVNLMDVPEEKAYALWDEIMAAAPMPMSENMICSGTFEGGKSSCNGDSGGPLVVPLDNGKYIQAGIVSWGLSDASGHGCPEMAQFSAYTDVSRFVPWLNEVITANP